MPNINELTTEQLKSLIHESVEETMEEFLEDLLALTSNGYLKSIEEARKDYKAGKVKSFKEAFDV